MTPPIARLRHLALAAGRLVGVDAGRAWRTVRNLPRFVHDVRKYRESETTPVRFGFHLRNVVPMLTDYDEQAGDTRGHYFYQDIWAARKIHRRGPSRHVDVGSRVDGFVAHLLTFMSVEVVDIRPLDAGLSGLRFVQDDATSLSSLPDASVESLSSLHAVEHFGLGRYGDPIDADGWRKGMGALERVLAPGGVLYFSVPIGRERLCFNAQRVFSPDTVLETFSALQLRSFSAVNDDLQFVENSDPSRFRSSRLACGLFEFFRRP